ncbi:hypothetical protein ACGFXC_04195 [Streptomyces sp. NPDC048507]|uniref:hypothetical protein n=1 Tax=Streptomyces sp. NPDC048507 TaxID=3365560 RepID=UPI003720EFAE
MNHSQDGTAAALLARLLLIPPPPGAGAGDPSRVLREGSPARTAAAAVAAAGGARGEAAPLLRAWVRDHLGPAGRWLGLHDALAGHRGTLPALLADVPPPAPPAAAGELRAPVPRSVHATLALLLEHARPEDAAAALSALPDAAVEAVLACGTPPGPGLVAAVTGYGDTRTRTALARHPRVDSRVLARLLAAGDGRVGAAVYRNPRCTPSLRRALVRDLDRIPMDADLRAELTAPGGRLPRTWLVPLLCSGDPALTGRALRLGCRGAAQQYALVRVWERAGPAALRALLEDAEVLRHLTGPVISDVSGALAEGGADALERLRARCEPYGDPARLPALLAVTRGTSSLRDLLGEPYAHDVRALAEAHAESPFMPRAGEELARHEAASDAQRLAFRLSALNEPWRRGGRRVGNVDPPAHRLAREPLDDGAARWAQGMAGAGLLDPVDLVRTAHPASRALDALARLDGRGLLGAAAPAALRALAAAHLGDRPGAWSALDALLPGHGGTVEEWITDAARSATPPPPTPGRGVPPLPVPGPEAAGRATPHASPSPTVPTVPAPAPAPGRGVPPLPAPGPDAAGRAAPHASANPTVPTVPHAGRGAAGPADAQAPASPGVPVAPAAATASGPGADGSADRRASAGPTVPDAAPEEPQASARPGGSVGPAAAPADAQDLAGPTGPAPASVPGPGAGGSADRRVSAGPTAPAAATAPRRAHERAGLAALDLLRSLAAAPEEVPSPADPGVLGFLARHRQEDAPGLATPDWLARACAARGVEPPGGGSWYTAPGLARVRAEPPVSWGSGVGLIDSAYTQGLLPADELPALLPARRLILLPHDWRRLAFAEAWRAAVARLLRAELGTDPDAWLRLADTASAAVGPADRHTAVGPSWTELLELSRSGPAADGADRHPAGPPGSLAPRPRTPQEALRLLERGNHGWAWPIGTLLGLADAEAFDAVLPRLGPDGPWLLAAHLLRHDRTPRIAFDRLLAQRDPRALHVLAAQSRWLPAGEEERLADLADPRVDLALLRHGTTARTARRVIARSLPRPGAGAATVGALVRADVQEDPSAPPAGGTGWLYSAEPDLIEEVFARQGAGLSLVQQVVGCLHLLEHGGAARLAGLVRRGPLGPAAARLCVKALAAPDPAAVLRARAARELDPAKAVTRLRRTRNAWQVPGALSAAPGGIDWAALEAAHAREPLPHWERIVNRADAPADLRLRHAALVAEPGPDGLPDGAALTRARARYGLGGLHHCPLTTQLDGLLAPGPHAPGPLTAADLLHVVAPAALVLAYLNGAARRTDAPPQAHAALAGLTALVADRLGSDAEAWARVAGRLTGRDPGWDPLSPVAALLD